MMMSSPQWVTDMQSADSPFSLRLTFTPFSSRSEEQKERGEPENAAPIVYFPKKIEMDATGDAGGTQILNFINRRRRVLSLVGFRLKPLSKTKLCSFPAWDEGSLRFNIKLKLLNIRRLSFFPEAHPDPTHSSPFNSLKKHSWKHLLEIWCRECLEFSERFFSKLGTPTLRTFWGGWKFSASGN